ncbi:MAG: MFS transporter [Chloroflexi bacterium]|nr:MFS transporter [Chloroflexota bacterium]
MSAAMAETAMRQRLPIFALFAANAISLTGNVLAVVAIPWFVLQTTGSATQTGITGFFTVLPIVVAAFFGGSLVDRLGFKRASISADLTSGVAIALIPLLYQFFGLAFWQLLLLVFIGNLLDAPGNTARAALVPDLAKLANMRLERAAATIQGIERGSRMIGAPLAGILITVFGSTIVLWIDAATFLASALIVAAFIPRLAHATSEKKSESYLAELTDGLWFIRRDGLILALTLTVMVTNFLDSPSGSVIMPVYVKEASGSAVDLGLFFAALGGGSLLGAIVFGAIGHRLPKRITFISLFIIMGLRFWVLAFAPSFPILLVAWFITGLAAGPINPIMATIEYERIPANMRGRVFGTMTAGAYLAIPLGMLLVGFSIEQIGIQWTVLAMGACYLVTTLSLIINPAIREMDRVGNDKPAREFSIGD